MWFPAPNIQRWFRNLVHVTCSTDTDSRVAKNVSFHRCVWDCEDPTTGNHMHHTATPLWYRSETLVEWNGLQRPMCRGSLNMKGESVLPRQKVGCCLADLQTSVSNGWQESWVLLAAKDILGTQTAAMFCYKHSFHYRSMFQSIIWGVVSLVQVIRVSRSFWSRRSNYGTF